MKMTPQERFITAARGGTVDRPPVWLMRQAGRYLPEYQELKSKYTFVERCIKPEIAHQISMQPWERYHMDGVVVFCDILMPLAAMGIDFSVPEGGPKLVPAINNLAALEKLRVPNAAHDYDYLMQTIGMLNNSLQDKAAVIGFCGAPWTVATYMVTGGKSSREGFPEELSDETFRNAVYDRLIPMLSDYLVAQIDAGAHVVQIFDTWAGNLTLEDFRKIALPALQELTERVKKQRGDTPITIFCKHCAHLLPALKDVTCDVVSIDEKTSISEVREILPGRAIQGNLNPELLLNATPEIIERATLEMLEEGGRSGYIANLGHGVLQHTPVENVAAFVGTVKNWL